MKERYDLCIIGGAGRVGLPLGVSFANSGLATVLFDINENALSKIKKGIFPFKEKDGEKSLLSAIKKGNIFFSSSPSVISDSKNVIIVVGTPTDKYLNPDLRDLKKVIEQYFNFFADGQILILRSTVYPGTSERIQDYFLKKRKKISVSFCPERIVEGKAIEELKKLPQIVSAFDENTFRQVKKIFKKLTPAKIIRLKPIEAELAKLFCNAWRYITFSVSNQFFMIAADYNLDFHKIYAAMNENYPRNLNLPKTGFAAGPCLFKDTLQLSAFANNRFFLGHAAMLINEGLPQFLIYKLRQKINLKDKIIGILGMAFKAESDDSRDSLSYKLKKIAETECEQVLCHDPYIKDLSFHPLKDVLESADVIILATPHKAYKKIKPSKWPDKIFIDIWDLWGTAMKI